MALSGDQDETVPPFLGAYGAVGTPFRSRRYSRPYQRIDQQERSDMPVGLGGHGWGFFLRRALIGVAVITFFIAGVSTANTRRLSATDWVHQQQSQQQRTPDSHPGILQVQSFFFVDEIIPHFWYWASLLSLFSKMSTPPLSCSVANMPRDLFRDSHTIPAKSPKFFSYIAATP